LTGRRSEESGLIDDSIGSPPQRRIFPTGARGPATSSIYGLIMLAVGVPLLAWAVIGLARESRS
jgi:hypothetical protein